jgi:MYXO-CTERM domain-containing protein
MKIRSAVSALAPGFAAILTISGSATAATVITDNFDSGTISSSWDTNTGNSVVSGGAAASPNAVTMAATTGALGESFGTVSPGGSEDFVVDYYFRVQAVAAPATTRQFNLQVSTTSTAPNTSAATVNLRYQNGGWALFNTAWVPVAGLPAVSDGAWYHMQLEGVDWGTAAASYSLRLSDAAGSAFTSTASGLTIVQNGNILGTKAQSFIFNTAFGANPGFSVDDVTVTTAEVVPEPGAATLGGLALLGLLRRRR